VRALEGRGLPITPLALGRRAPDLRRPEVVEILDSLVVRP